VVSEAVIERPPLAVTFDATGTLIRCPRLGEIYAEVLGRHGVRLDPDAIAATFAVVWKELDCRLAPGADRFTAHPDGERGFWRELLERLCALLGAPAPSRFAAAELFRRFKLAESWAVVPGAAKCLERLSDARLRLGVIANWDSRLEPLLEALGLRDFFDTVVRSSALGVAKPSPRIFLEAATQLGVPSERVLHVGDRPLEDRDGARAAGMQALLVAADAPEDCAVSDLTTLADRLLDESPIVPTLAPSESKR
jgi:putative hydrolase of the HAD superfamily